MLSMAKHKPGKLNWLEEHLPEGLVVDAAWLSKHGYSTSLRSQYVAAGWLEQPARGVYHRRLRGALTWQQVVISLQTILAHPIEVGGRTALELQGYAHYLPHDAKEVHLYGSKPPPNWLHKLRVGVRFVYHNDQKLFRHQPITRGLSNLNWDVAKGQGESTDAIHGSLTVQRWGQWNWPLTLSTPERALFELLDELPNRESFDQVDKLMGGLTNLSPRRLQKLLADCRSVKVKRLFFFFADRHQHAWLKRLDKSAIDLGQGNRMLVKGGRLDRTYKITIPEALDGVP
jgi:Transcriptional regulator, AbiEi antitoxin, Type IV TA system/Transcriptional regulator, AbiEi antitoxin N-terminal domain